MFKIKATLRRELLFTCLFVYYCLFCFFVFFKLICSISIPHTWDGGISSGSGLILFYILHENAKNNSFNTFVFHIFLTIRLFRKFYKIIILNYLGK